MRMNQSNGILKFRDALRRALISYENPNGKKGIQVHKGDALRHIATSLIHLAINGAERDRMPAIKELIDRLDGKAVQAISGPEGEPITVVQRIIVQQAIENEAEPQAAYTIEQDPKLIN